MRTIIAGSRDCLDFEILLETIGKVPWEITSVVCGMARGADLLGRNLALEAGLDMHEFPADWKGLGKSAGYRRNEQMAEFAEACIVLWDGESRGSKHCLNLCAEKYKLPTVVYRYLSKEFEFYNC